METVLLAIHVVCSFLLVGAILLQSGKGGGLAAGFGGASAGTQMFGGAGAGGFMSKATIVLAAIFMSTSLALAYLSSQPRSAMSLEGPGVTGTMEDEIVESGNGDGEGAAAPAGDEADDEAEGQPAGEQPPMFDEPESATPETVPPAASPEEEELVDPVEGGSVAPKAGGDQDEE